MLIEKEVIVILNRKKLTGAALLTTCLLLIPMTSVKQFGRSARAEDHQTLTEQIHTIVNNKRLKGAIAGVSVRSAITGELLFDHHGDTRLTPASNMKLLTAAAALETLGSDYRFKTVVFADHRNGEIISGNLYIKGSGDPTLLPKDFDALANQLKLLGITQVDGDLIGDESWYDSEYLSEDMIWSDEDQYYGAQISALTASPNQDYDAGTIMIEVSPGSGEGLLSSVKLTPETDTISIINNGMTVNENEDAEIEIHRKHGTNIIVVDGTISKNASREKAWVAVWNPASYALNLFAQSLKKHGIEIKGEERLGKTSDQAIPLAEKKSMPLSDLLIPFMKLSNNGHAEVLVKEMGKVVKEEGSFQAGLEVIRSVLRNEGLHTDDMCLRDGSGISQITLIQPNQLSLLLYRIQEKPWFDLYLNSLPIAGEPERLVGGTLRNRLSNTVAEGVIYAKTGSLIGVTSLSGYVRTEHPLIFSVILNQFIDEEEMGKIEDQIAVVLANYKEANKRKG
ncbi:D-alanyl-D-alanine carboxypeptidase/D-alanyl-D-alanine-endopeptidase [Bacillus sp. NTK071]|uniref:D-alanyl-D-alanine carboxypeptidase/D-alanyl-D-alanine endopeptidase n=1 Tax=Bacillus sp. NTK071 TaxID=2802175 RepID=UPI001A8CDD61|nr:D-alanyl-D-alanine carboxypeptidase/D-alanyl-D-alanine-endopeptidase [Bacillus sp. NTK071]MBN8207739.1 D-alanyl-D-alanine carboxypeptidase/D-alanyl-D-alanine-endopeptidase [Bacillus sp. NTK071]